MGMFELIKISLWNNGDSGLSVSEEDYNEMKMHAIIALPAGRLSNLKLTNELKSKWRKDILLQMSNYIQYTQMQSVLPISVPYTVLKGSSAAQYYPYPEYRAMGDIDIMTRREDFDTAYRQLLNNGYRIVKEENREIGFVKNHIVVELHRQFASLNNTDYAKHLDDLIIENINPTHVLPDFVNGLVLLEHINQHLENGLGLRQIIDWMMFADKCIEGEGWKEFLDLAEEIGLKKLAIAVAGMCEIYLGLKPRDYFVDKDTDLCRQLMDYILSNGDFGCKRTADEDTSEKVFAKATTPKMVFRILQEQGLVNWKSAQRHSMLRPFAWIYQLGRYIYRGLKRDHATAKIKEEYLSAKKRNIMFDKLGIKRASKGLTIYEDGKYVKR